MLQLFLLGDGLWDRRKHPFWPVVKALGHLLGLFEFSFLCSQLAFLNSSYDLLFSLDGEFTARFRVNDSISRHFFQGIRDQVSCHIVDFESITIEVVFLFGVSSSQKLAKNLSVSLKSHFHPR